MQNMFYTLVNTLTSSAPFFLPIFCFSGLLLLFLLCVLLVRFLPFFQNTYWSKNQQKNARSFFCRHLATAKNAYQILITADKNAAKQREKAGNPRGGFRAFVSRLNFVVCIHSGYTEPIKLSFRKRNDKMYIKYSPVHNSNFISNIRNSIFARTKIELYSKKTTALHTLIWQTFPF